MFDRIISGALALCSTAGLLACIPAAYPDLRSADTGEAKAGTPVQNTAQIEGQWDIVRFDGYEPRRLQGTTRAAFANFHGQHVGLRIECNSSGVSGRIDNGGFYSMPGDRIQTAMGCGREREERDAALFRFDRNPTVERLANGRLRLAADDTELLLERPAQRRLAYLPSAQELLGEWRLVEITRFAPSGGYTGIGLSDVAGVLAFDGIKASFAPCPAFALSYRYTAEGRIEKIGGPNLPSERVACDALKQEWRGENMPVPWDVMRVLHDNPMVERVDANTLMMSTERFGVLLSRDERDGSQP